MKAWTAPQNADMAGSHRHCCWRSMGAAAAPRARHCRTVSACQAANAAATGLSQRAGPLTGWPAPGSARLPLSPGLGNPAKRTGPGLQAARGGDASPPLPDTPSGASVKSGGAPWPGPRALHAFPAEPSSRPHGSGAEQGSHWPKGPSASAGRPPCRSGPAAAGGRTAVRVQALAARAAMTAHCSLRTRKCTALRSSNLSSPHDLSRPCSWHAFAQAYRPDRGVTGLQLSSLPMTALEHVSCNV